MTKLSPFLKLPILISFLGKFWKQSKKRHFYTLGVWI